MSLIAPSCRSRIIGVALVAAVVAACAARQPTVPQDVAVTRNLDYAQRDDGPLLADVYAPTGGTVHPGVLLVHGGSWRRGSKRSMARIATRLAEHGYIAVAIDYRLAPEHKFPAQIHDCKDAVRRAVAFLDRWLTARADAPSVVAAMHSVE